MFFFFRFPSPWLTAASLTCLSLSVSAFAQNVNKAASQATTLKSPSQKPVHAAAASKTATLASVKKAPLYKIQTFPSQKSPHKKIGHLHKICKTSSPHVRHHKKAKVLQCVGYVHLAAPHFKIHGDAHTWWKRADQHHYLKGQLPEPGAVLSFRATKKMFYGHVALVRSQEDDRTIRIDHAHWGINGIDHNVRCVDVSKHNDWTAVRVAIRNNEKLLGSVYPTNGFIYPWTKEEAEQQEKILRDRPFGNRPTKHIKFKLPDTP